MQLIIRRKNNGYEVIYTANEHSGQDGQAYELNNTDEVLGRAVSLIIDFFRTDQQEIKPIK